MVSIYPSDFYAPMFHNVVANGNYKSRLLIYSIDLANNPIDVWEKAWVEEYGTLLKYKVTDTDSNGRIAEKGIRINNYYNKEEQHQIGNAYINSIDIALINDDGFFASYDWSQTIILYWDVYDPDNDFWYSCPLGIYWWERPAKTSDIVVEARAYDGMYLLDQRVDYRFPSFSGGKTGADIYNSIVGYIAGLVKYSTPTDWANMSETYYSAPFDPTGMTRREVLGKLAEIAGANAYISRNGVVMMKPFTDATWKTAPQAQPTYYQIDGDTIPTNLLKIDIGEYTVPLVDKFIARVGQTGQEYTSGTGDNVMYSFDNGFLGKGVALATAQTMVDRMYGVVSGQHSTSNMVAYNPLSIKVLADPTLEAGDIIRVIRNDTTYLMPIFQQILRWRGGEWIAELQNSGYEKRTVPSEADRVGSAFEGRLSELEPYEGGADSTDSTPYSFRRSGGGTLGTVNRETDSLIGGTVAWNQKVVNGNFVSSSSWTTQNCSLSVSGNVATVTATAKWGRIESASISIVAGHKYFVSAMIKGDTDNYVSFISANKYVSVVDTFQTCAFIQSAPSTGNFKLAVGDRKASGWTAYAVKNVIVHDLTAMFGSTIADYVYTLESGTAGAGIAWLKSYGFFTEDYYPYHAATLESVKTSAHVMRDADDNIIGNYALDPIDLRGILKKDASNNLYYDGDTYEADGTVTRKYGIVDLGTLTWTKWSAGIGDIFITTLSDAKHVSSNTETFNGISSAFKLVSRATLNGTLIENVVALNILSDLLVHPTAMYTDAATFKTAMSGVYLVYEIATETTETASPYINPQIVDALGTEQYVDAGTRDFDMPVGHETSYYNLASDAQQIYDTPTADGTYRLICTVVNGTPSYSWAAET